MSELSSSSSSSSSSDDENAEDTSGSESSSSSSSSESDKQDINDNRTWMLDHHEPNLRPANTSNNHDMNHTGLGDGTSSDDDQKRQRTNLPQKSQKEDLRTLWESNPQIYGVRRSSRARKEPERLTVFQDSEDSDGNKKRRGRRRSKQENADYTGTLTDSDSEGESASEFDSPPMYHRKKHKTKGMQKRNTGRSSKLSQMRAKLEGKKQGGRKGRPRTKKQTESDLSDESSSEDDRPQRSSSRIQKGKISYKEESQDETDSDDVMEVVEKEDETANSECIERVMDDRVGKRGATGAVTTWYTVLSNSDPNDSFNSEEEDGEQQFLISWKGWSHMHNTWESEKSLQDQKVRGMKKLENYIKKKDELDAWLKLATPEDAEYFLCQQELGRDLVSTYRTVERVIAKSRLKNSTGYWDYQVKWKGLPYVECTWEDGELITKYFNDEVEKFEIRQENGRVPRRDGKMRLQNRFTPIKGTPSWLNNVEYSLRDYQTDGVNWLANSWCRNNSVILADEMGLGKTIQSITFLSYLYHIHDVYGPFLIIVPLSTIASWQREFQTWAPFMNVIIFVGDATSRTVIKDVEWVFPNKKLKFNVVLTTYEILLKEKTFLGSHNWAVIAVDEAHRLKNEDSLLYRSLIEFKSHHRLLITGTPLQNSLKELWSLLHFIMPERFDSWPDFEERHSNERETGYTSLHKILQPFLLRRVKKDVEKSLPAKVERILRVEMSSIQKQYYRWILTKNYRELSKGNKGKVSSFCNIVMELKKCCNHAFLTKGNDKEPVNNEEKLQTLIRSSGKMILLDKLLRRLREDGHRVLIFSQMVRMLDLLQQYLILNRIGFQRLDGSIKGETRRQALERFNAPGSEDFCFLLSTRAGGLGINLASADTVIIFDSDWNPQNDLQAQARAHRIGQTNQVNIYRLVCVGSVEEDIIEKAKRKMVLDHLVIQRMDTSGKTVLSKNNAPSASTGNPFNKEELSAILKFGAEDLFKETEGEEKEPECDIDEILRRAETAEEHAESGVGDELLSAFKFATFTFDEDEETTSTTVKNEDEDSRDGLKDWDDIIPEADRKIIEEEERKKQEAELYLPPRIRKSLKMNAGGSESEAGSEDSDEDGSDDEEQEDNDTAPKKKGRRRAAQKDAFTGFTTGEVRKFVKSFRKFGNPLERLDAIARDAELTVQSEADLKRLGEKLDSQLREMMQAHNKSLLQNTEEQTPQQTSKRGPSFRIGGASVSVKTTMACIEELAPLVDVMPKNADDRKIFRLTIPVKPIRGWDCPWSSEDDSNLLIGIYEYGMGSWEQLQSDPSLGLEKKILRPNNEKPQAKQLQSRVEYLMKLLRKTKELGRAPTAALSASNSALSAAASRVARKVRQGKKAEADKSIDDSKKRSRKIKSKAKVDVADDSDVEMGALETVEGKKKEKKSRKIQKKPKPNSSHNSIDNDTKKSRAENDKDGTKDKNRKIKKKHKAKDNGIDGSNNHSEKKKDTSKTDKKTQGPVHISAASDPVPIGQDEFLGELDQETFKECKERMRPVKKALKLLDKPPSEAAKDEKAQHEHIKTCVLKIGDRVLECLREFHDRDTIQKWRKNLWIFVSKFTEFNAQGLHKMYKKAARKREEQKRKIKNKPGHPGSGDHSVSAGQSSKTNAKEGGLHKNQNSGAKKRPHSPSRSRGAGDGPTAGSKRSYNPPDHQRDRLPHHSNPRKGDNYHDRYHGQGYPRDGQHDDRRLGDENIRYGHGAGQRHDWPRRGDEYRYRHEDEYRRRDYDSGPRHPYDGPYMHPRDDRNYSGYRRSPYPDHGPSHPEERPGSWDRAYTNSHRSSSPHHHPSRSRSPMRPHYPNPNRPAHHKMHSPTNSSQMHKQTNPEDIVTRDTVT